MARMAGTLFFTDAGRMLLAIEFVDRAAGYVKGLRSSSAL
jgi:hypothetical protein